MKRFGVLLVFALVLGLTLPAMGRTLPFTVTSTTASSYTPTKMASSRQSSRV